MKSLHWARRRFSSLCQRASHGSSFRHCGNPAAWFHDKCRMLHGRPRWHQCIVADRVAYSPSNRLLLTSPFRQPMFFVSARNKNDIRLHFSSNRKQRYPLQPTCAVVH
ncbi:hypothetical protein I603_2127 [Erythrobacter dokdonensis DSW-74]|uniref:Uncharacterized protein n=1 Tax=Erythrobacter dokdonensis DSW-74 TaxID=1300349 RepID=A0A1A7BH35_9SPHN|nr:hypothetical protein I603_2127 [Erythrobacter dokdonensis DSW-74]